jgi:hypothetical protein
MYANNINFPTKPKRRLRLSPREEKEAFLYYILYATHIKKHLSISFFDASQQH